MVFSCCKRYFCGGFVVVSFAFFVVFWWCVYVVPVMLLLLFQCKLLCYVNMCFSTHTARVSKLLLRYINTPMSIIFCLMLRTYIQKVLGCVKKYVFYFLWSHLCEQILLDVPCAWSLLLCLPTLATTVLPFLMRLLGLLGVYVTLKVWVPACCVLLTLFFFVVRFNCRGGLNLLHWALQPTASTRNHRTPATTLSVSPHILLRNLLVIMAENTAYLSPYVWPHDWFFH